MSRPRLKAVAWTRRRLRIFGCPGSETFTCILANAAQIAQVPAAVARVFNLVSIDMTVFPTFRHVASWAALCPGQNESPGKRRSGKTGRGNRWPRTALIEAALAASRRSAQGAFAAWYRRIMQHRGQKKAIVAVAHAMLVTVYLLLARRTTFRDPGAD